MRRPAFVKNPPGGASAPKKVPAPKTAKAGKGAPAVKGGKKLPPWLMGKKK